MKLSVLLVLLTTSFSFARTYTFQCSWFNQDNQGYEQQFVVKIDSDDYSNGGGNATFKYIAWNGDARRMVTIEEGNVMVSEAIMLRDNYFFKISLGRSKFINIDSLKSYKTGNATITGFYNFIKDPTDDIICKFFDGSGIVH